MKQTDVNLDMSAPAALVWLPLGERPAADSFGPEEWVLEDAMDRASMGEPGKAPWIKIGDSILEPGEIAKAFITLR